MRDFRKRIAVSYVQANETQITGFDLPQFLQHLVLFDSVVLKSGRLMDLGYLIRHVGFDTALQLIQARGVSISCDACALVRAGEPRITARARGTVRLQGLEYRIVHFGRSHAEWIDSGFAEAISIAGLTRGRASKFENVVRSKLMPKASAALTEAQSAARDDLLIVSQSVRESVRTALRRRLLGELPSVGAYALDVGFTTGRGYTVDSDLPRVLSLPESDVGAAINEGLLGAVGIHAILAEMRRHEAMVGMQEEDMSVLDAKLAVAANYSADAQSRRFTRVVSTLELPDIGVSDRLKFPTQ